MPGREHVWLFCVARGVLDTARHSATRAVSDGLVGGRGRIGRAFEKTARRFERLQHLIRPRRLQHDSLVILERGRIAEQGSHDALLAVDGIYSALWTHQSGGFLPLSDDEREDAAEGNLSIA